MSEFLNLLAPDEAVRVLRDRLSPRVESEVVLTAEALGRVTASDIRSPEDLPAFPRSTMDGFSLRSSDTFGASEGVPAYLDVVGEVPMGQQSQLALSAGQAALAYTGGMLAGGADAVIMVEHTQPVGDSTIEVMRPVAPGENVVHVGEDMRIGDQVLPAGHVLRPQDLGGLLALGITRLDVGRRPRVGIVSTGDELVAPESTPGPGRIRDINTYTISALVTEAGGVPVVTGLVGDDFEAQRNVAADLLDKNDILVFSAGSSVSSRDLTASVIDSLGSPGVLAHGISLRPGKPTIVGLVDGKPAIGLPGNPVSAMVVFDLLVRPIVYLLSGCRQPPDPPTARAKLSRDIPSLAGREDWVQVRLDRQDGHITADPVFGNSNLIYTLVRADGVVKVPLDRGGLYTGEEVAVRLY